MSNAQNSMFCGGWFEGCRWRLDINLILNSYLCNVHTGKVDAASSRNIHHDVNKWKLFPHYWPYEGPAIRSRINASFCAISLTGGFPDKTAIQRFVAVFDVSLNKLLKRRAQLSEIWDAMTLMWRYYHVSMTGHATIKQVFVVFTKANIVYGMVKGTIACNFFNGLESHVTLNTSPFLSISRNARDATLRVSR